MPELKLRRVNRHSDEKYPMPHYYFDLADGQIVDPGDHTVEIATVQEAELQAAIFLARHLADIVSDITEERVMGVIIRDKSGKAVARVAITLHFQELH